jgi:anaerobic selenocysteine-containing dehydrogenase
MTAQSRDGSDALIAAGSAGLTPPRLYGWVRENALPEGRWRLTPPNMLERLANIAANFPIKLPSAQAGNDPNEVEQSEQTGTPLLLVNGRQLSRTNSTRYVSSSVSRDLPHVHINSYDAEHRGLQDGNRVQVVSQFGKVSAEVHIDNRLRRGVISMSQGWHEANVSHLTSATSGVDPLTTQPQMTALQVSLTRVA